GSNRPGVEGLWLAFDKEAELRAHRGHEKGNGCGHQACQSRACNRMPSCCCNKAATRPCQIPAWRVRPSSCLGPRSGRPAGAGNLRQEAISSERKYFARKRAGTFFESFGHARNFPLWLHSAKVRSPIRISSTEWLALPSPSRP